MSRIDKLSILGVRSFDNARSESIHFQAPLTLIVGLNGSGKTTIIECLKYAMTGEFPPNAKQSGAFIHDPKLCGEKEVLAQIKVLFRSTEGVRMVCTRNLQLTVKKTQRSMKTLEGSLLMMRNGEKLTMSSTVAELNTMIPQYLGVSRAIIDSVILCHQEESMWPLSEPAKLKVRFDEIFEAQKYTKAIENIKVLQKNQKQFLAVFKKDEEYLKSEKDRGDKMEKQSRELHAQIDELRTQSDEKHDQIKDLARKAEQAWEKAQTAGMIVGELNGKRIEAKTKEESVHSLRENLKEMEDSDEDLQRMLEKYEERVQVYEHDLAKSKDRWKELNDEIQDGRTKVIAKERECGSYEAQKENHERQLEYREKLVKETARSHSIRGFDYAIDDAQVEAFMDRITRMAKDQNAAFERARQEAQEELAVAQKALNRINEQKSVLNQRKESSRHSLASNDQKIGSLQRELDNIDVDEGRVATMQSEEQEKNARLTEAKSSMGSAKWADNIERDEAELRQLDDRKERLDAELVESTRKAGESARLDFIQKELKARQNSLATMVGAHADKIGSVVGADWSHSSLEANFQRTLEKSSSLVVEAERQRDGMTREKEQVEYQLNNCKSELKSKRKNLMLSEKAIREAIEGEPADYPEEIAILEKNRETMKADEDSFGVINSYFDMCIKDATSHSTCRTCTRKLKEKEIDVLVKNIEKMRSRVSTNDQTKAELREVEQALQLARSARSHYDDWERLRSKEIPPLEQEEQTLVSKSDQLNSQLEEQDIILGERQSAKRDIESISRTVQTIVKYSSDINTFEGQIRELTAKAEAVGLSRSLDQIQQDLKTATDGARNVKARIQQSTGDRDRNLALINNLELEIKDLQSKMNTAQYQLKEKASYARQIEEYKTLNGDQRENIRAIDRDLQSLAQELSQAQIKYDDIAHKAAGNDREQQAVVNKLNNSVNQLKLADQEISAYVAKGGPQQLERGRREVEHLKEEVSRLERDQSNLVREVKTLEDQLRNHGDTKRSIADNQRYRRDLRQLNRVREEIAELETHNAEEDKMNWEREGHQWQMSRNKLAGEQATIVGSLKSKDDQLKQMLDDWDQDYRDAGKKYKEAHIKVETTKACIEDLGRYSGALDKAIMKYHAIKMEEINRIIDELWRKTYQGTDVDTIMIRSESENVKSNKSYNYRVCMLKQDVEMDMRGRCSAGQKVLASILIRLALAECFGTRCGLIALDEPTTNLDHDNIRALATSLAEIIRLRRSQPNFQIIVITHDEEFLRYMNCSDFADFYWRVGRNDKQKSQIERQNISEVV